MDQMAPLEGAMCGNCTEGFVGDGMKCDGKRQNDTRGISLEEYHSRNITRGISLEEYHSRNITRGISLEEYHSRNITDAHSYLIESTSS